MPAETRLQAALQSQNRQTKRGNITMPTPPWQSKNKSGSNQDNMDSLRAEIQILRDQLEVYRHDTTAKLESLQLESTADKKISELRHYIDSENGILIRRFEDIENRLTRIEERFQYDPEVTVIAQGVPPTHNEDPEQVAQELIRKGLNTVDIPVVRAKRLATRNPNKPGLLKIELPNLDAKKKILRRKTELSKVPQYRRVYLRSSKSHVERLLELNTKTLLEQMPTGNQFRLTGNGRLIHANEDYRHGPPVWNGPGPSYHQQPGPPPFGQPPGPPFGQPPVMGMYPRPPPPQWVSRPNGPPPVPSQTNTQHRPQPETQADFSHL